MILIRADANETIGTGHVMRCLSIANAFVKIGHKVKFVTADQKGDALIRDRSFDSICLNSEWTNMESELMVLKEILDENSPSLTLVDSYYVTNKYFRELRNRTRIAYIDDLNKERWGIDYLINYNIFASIFDYSGYDRDTKLILSPKYAPLREEFQNAPRHEIKKPSDILVSAGGADPEHITEKILEAICSKMPEFTFHFIVGALNPRLKEIKDKSGAMANVILHVNEKHMADLMRKCDIAVSAAGSTLYELCATGVPTITYTLADNQFVAAEEFEKQGIMLNAGDCRNNGHFVETVKMLLMDLIYDKNRRGVFSAHMQKLVDGVGAQRIASCLTEQFV